jgi:hypothetical protein
MGMAAFGDYFDALKVKASAQWREGKSPSTLTILVA